MMFLYERYCFFSITSYALMPFFLVLESVDNALCHIYVEELEELYQAFRNRDKMKHDAIGKLLDQVMH